ncbi:AAA family ATPase [Candidatus Ferrigenium straubiae]|jgi:type II secretory pathway predicted ATPase ExeA|uniref:AAA family ATPase n=1 Tax=Candidatus Ferrigenium straubiae TaxID=2919506 RepID=UPI003F4AAD14
MYLEHFGLDEPPFRITPVTVFFFSGANRGEILEALIYSLSEAEGIIKVSGEVGSGKTMLCRMLLERLPKHVETIYLANPSLSREEMLYAIADALGLSIDGKRVGIVMHSIQSKLEEKAREGKRIVVLVDEAHAMPLDTLEELRLLYNLQIGNAKLLQIILFGQPELNAKLDQPNMRQLKDRIVHHFHIQPLSRNTLESYLMFRMRAAGYRGPDIFSPNAIKLIAEASNGLMRRINILADKSLLAAFVEDTHNIEARHVQAAMRDSELKPARSLPGRKLLIGSAAGILLLAGLASWWLLNKPSAPIQQAALATKGQVQDKSAEPVLPPPVTATAQPDPAPAKKTSPATVTASLAPPPLPAATSLPPSAAPVAAGSSSLYEQRLAAGRQLLEQKKAAASIQLFYSEEVKLERIENFLRRAKGLGKLPEIYLLPARFGDRDGLRVLYGAYPSANAAQNAIKELPQRYQEAFTVSVYTF